MLGAFSYVFDRFLGPQPAHTAMRPARAPGARARGRAPAVAGPSPSRLAELMLVHSLQGGSGLDGALLMAAVAMKGSRPGPLLLP